MGRRSQNKVWEHFEKVERTKKNQYFYVSCNHCKNEGMDGPFEGRIIAMERHLRKCKSYIESNDASEYSSKPASSASSISKVNAAKRKKIDQFVDQKVKKSDVKKVTKRQKKDQSKDQKLSESDAAVFHRLLLEMIADCGLSFRWIEKPSVRRLFEFLRPSLKNDLPSPRMLSGKFLEEYSLATQNEMLPRLRSLVNMGCVLNFVCDSWVDISKNHVLGCVVSLGDLWFPFDEALGRENIIDQSRHDGIATAQLIERAMTETEIRLKLSVGSVVTNDSGYCASAKRILALRFPNKYFGRCYAQQVNLIVKDVLKAVNPELVDRAKNLVATYTRSTSKWLQILTDECQKMYGTFRSLNQVCEIRWNSMQGCFASILRIRSALRVVEAKYGDSASFPENLRVSMDFFEELAAAQTLILPLTKASYMMQRDANTLADVVNMFGYIYIKFQESEKYGLELTELLEKRWNQQEHPLLILAYFLHPKFVKSFRTMADSVSDFSLLNMIAFAFLYYKKFVGDISCEDLSVEVNMWYRDTSKHARFACGLPTFDFWHTIKGELPHLSKLALVLLSFNPQSANCERLFSAFGNFKTKPRNRMHSSKARYLTQVQRNVLTLDEMEIHNEVKNAKRIVSADELPQAVKKDRFLEDDNVKEEEDSEIVGDDDNSDGGHDDDDDDDGDETITTDSYFAEWMEALDNLDCTQDIEDDEGLGMLELDSDIEEMTFDDGVTFREQHPYSDENITSFPEETLSNTRKTKIPLQRMFIFDDIAIDIFSE